MLHVYKLHLDRMYGPLMGRRLLVIGKKKGETSIKKIDGGFAAFFWVVDGSHMIIWAVWKIPTLVDSDYRWLCCRLYNTSIWGLSQSINWDSPLKLWSIGLPVCLNILEWDILSTVDRYILVFQNISRTWIYYIGYLSKSVMSILF